MLATMVGTENNLTLGPRDGGIVEREPRHAEDDRVMTEARSVELNVLCMRASLKLNWGGFVGDGAGGDGTPVDNLKVSRHSLEPEGDGDGLSESDIDKGRWGAGVDQSEGWNRGAGIADSDRQNNIFFVFWAIGR
jgi:hypothetical protein